MGGRPIKAGDGESGDHVTYRVQMTFPDELIYNIHVAVSELINHPSKASGIESI